MVTEELEPRSLWTGLDVRCSSYHANYDVGGTHGLLKLLLAPAAIVLQGISGSLRPVPPLPTSPSSFSSLTQVQEGGRHISAILNYSCGKNHIQASRPSIASITLKITNSQNFTTQLQIFAIQYTERRQQCSVVLFSTFLRSSSLFSPTFHNHRQSSSIPQLS